MAKLYCLVWSVLWFQFACLFLFVVAGDSFSNNLCQNVFSLEEAKGEEEWIFGTTKRENLLPNKNQNIDNDKNGSIDRFSCGPNPFCDPVLSSSSSNLSLSPTSPPSPSPPSPSCEENRIVYYNFKAERDGVFRFSVCPSKEEDEEEGEEEGEEETKFFLSVVHGSNCNGTCLLSWRRPSCSFFGREASDLFLEKEEEVTLAISSVGQNEADFQVQVLKIEIPSNTACSQPKRLLINNLVEGSTRYANSSTLFPPCQESQAPELFYVFTAHISGFYQFSVCEDEEEENGEEDEDEDSLEKETPFLPLVSVFQGTCDQPICIPQTQISCSPTRKGGIVMKELTIGEEVFVIVHGNTSQTGGNFTIKVTTYDLPLGTTCDAPIEVKENELTHGMTLNFDEGNLALLCGKRHGPLFQTFYKLTPSFPRWFSVSLMSYPGASHQLNVIERCTGKSCLASSFPKPDVYYISREVYLVVSSNRNEVGAFDLLLSTFEPISPNSFCPGAVPFTPGERVTGETSHAVGLNPLFRGDCEAHRVPYPGLFFKFKALRKTTYQFFLEIAPFSRSDLHTFSVWRGTCDAPIQVSCTSNTKFGEREFFLKLDLEEEEEILILFSAMRHVHFNFSVVDTLPPNIFCSNATDLVVGHQYLFSTPRTGTRFVDDNFEQNCHQLPNYWRQNAMYYKFTAPLTKVYSFYFGAINIQTPILSPDFYLGGCDDPVCFPLNDIHSGKFFFELEKDQAINLVIYSSTLRFDLVLNEAISPPNLNCETAQQVSEGEFLEGTTESAFSNHPLFPTCSSITPKAGFTHKPMVFHSFTTRSKGTYNFKLSARYVGWIGVYRGTCADPLLIAESCLETERKHSELSVELRKGETVILTIQAHGAENQTGGFILLVDSAERRGSPFFGLFVGAIVLGVFLIPFLVGLFFMQKYSQPHARLLDDDDDDGDGDGDGDGGDGDGGDGDGDGDGDDPQDQEIVEMSEFSESEDQVVDLEGVASVLEQEGEENEHQFGDSNIECGERIYLEDE